MSEQTPTSDAPSERRQAALARWDDEGGAGPCGPQDGSQPDLDHGDEGASVDAELTRLRVRIIALENLTIALLADASPRQLDLIRDMAAFITPRPGATRHPIPGATRHPITIQAAGEMIRIIDRANHFRDAGHDAE